LVPVDDNVPLPIMKRGDAPIGTSPRVWRTLN